MLSRLKLLLTAVIACAALALAVGGAQATNSFSISPGGNISSTSLGKLSFASSAATVQCEVTLRGTLSSGGLIVLIELLLMGAITEVSINNRREEEGNPRGCRNGTVIPPVLNLPWRIVFRTLREAGGGTGQLLGLSTRAKLIQIRGTQFKLELFGVQCLYEGNAGGDVAVTPQAGGEAHRTDFLTGLVRALEEIRIPKHEGGFLCPESGNFRGNLTLTPTQKFIKRIPL